MDACPKCHPACTHVSAHLHLRITCVTLMSGRPHSGAELPRSAAVEDVPDRGFGNADQSQPGLGHD